MFFRVDPTGCLRFCVDDGVYLASEVALRRGEAFDDLIEPCAPDDQQVDVAVLPDPGSPGNRPEDPRDADLIGERLQRPS